MKKERKKQTENAYNVIDLRIAIHVGNDERSDRLIELKHTLLGV